jgi:hypothetical protein
MSRTPGAALAGFPVAEGLLESELQKAVDNPASRKNIREVRRHLSAAALLHTVAGRRQLARARVRSRRAR